MVMNTTESLSDLRTSLKELSEKMAAVTNPTHYQKTTNMLLFEILIELRSLTEVQIRNTDPDKP